MSWRLPPNSKVYVDGWQDIQDVETPYDLLIDGKQYSKDVFSSDKQLAILKIKPIIEMAVDERYYKKTKKTITETETEVAITYEYEPIFSAVDMANRKIAFYTKQYHDENKDLPKEINRELKTLGEQKKYQEIIDYSWGGNNAYFI